MQGDDNGNGMDSSLLEAFDNVAKQSEWCLQCGDFVLESKLFYALDSFMH